MGKTAWPTATEIKNQITTLNVTLNALVTDQVVNDYVNGIVEQIENKTKRQFLPTEAGVVRYFDGNKSPVLTIDDYVDISKVELVTSQAVSVLEITTYVEIETAKYPKNKISLFQGAALLSIAGLGYVFPYGKRNIKVTGQWGYASEIPTDVWIFVKDHTAFTIADQAITTAGGKLKKWTDLLASEEYTTNTIYNTHNMERRLRTLIKMYAKPQNRKPRSGVLLH